MRSWDVNTRIVFNGIGGEVFPFDVEANEGLERVIQQLKARKLEM